MSTNEMSFVLKGSPVIFWFGPKGLNSMALMPFLKTL